MATVERLQWPNPDTAPDSILDHYKHGPTLEVPSTTLHELQTLMQNPASFDWPLPGTFVMKPCLPDYTVVFTFHGSQGDVRATFCLHCGLFLVLDGNTPVNAMQDFDLIRGRIRELLIPLFPGDADIKGH